MRLFLIAVLQVLLGVGVGLGLSASTAKAQILQLAGLNFTRFPEAQLQDSDISQEVELNEYNTFVNLPLVSDSGRTVQEIVSWQAGKAGR